MSVLWLGAPMISPDDTSEAPVLCERVEKGQSPLASRMGEIAQHIVAAMPKPEFSPYSETSACEARRDLVSLLTTSTVFLQPAAESLWECPTNIQVLWRVLAGVAGEGAASTAEMSLHDAEMYIFAQVKHLINLNKAYENNVFTRFRFYASCIVRLRASSKDTPITLLTYLSSYLSSSRLLPRLEELSWVEEKPCMFTGVLTKMLSFSRVSTLTVQFQDQPVITTTPEGRNFYAGSVHEVLLTLPEVAPELRELTVHAPSAVSISLPAVLRFESLRRANLQISILGPTDVPPELETLSVECLEALEVPWTSDTDFNTVGAVLDQAQLRELTIKAYRHLGQKFLYDMFLLAARTSSSLTHIEIFALGETVSPDANTRLIDHFKPLLARHSLQHVSIVLSGYRFDFPPVDLDLMAHAWPDLRHLNLSFGLLDYASIPNLASTLPNICDYCPLLEFLHLPVIGTCAGSGLFYLPQVLESPLAHVSSDVAWFSAQHTIIDIAWSLQNAFPRLHRVGGFLEDWSGWFETNLLLTAIRNSDYATIFEHVARCIRAGACRPIPASLFLIVLVAIDEYNNTSGSQ